MNFLANPIHREFPIVVSCFILQLCRYFDKDKRFVSSLHPSSKPPLSKSFLGLIKIIWLSKCLFTSHESCQPRFTPLVHILTTHQRAYNRVLNSPCKIRQQSNQHFKQHGELIFVPIKLNNFFKDILYHQLFWNIYHLRLSCNVLFSIWLTILVRCQWQGDFSKPHSMIPKDWKLCCLATIYSSNAMKEMQCHTVLLQAILLYTMHQTGLINYFLWSHLLISMLWNKDFTAREHPFLPLEETFLPIPLQTCSKILIQGGKLEICLK